ncbi:hypothetical protein HDU85_001773 [Gaertneriomyces sp. JEL0708]|nr:DnaJ domain-containing protein [Gaertneriomyces semiglobifer]KAJ3184468.1 hypothetical protein HDU85_001773 [Gaertneriomyces sp. JEL0708]
MRAHLRHNLNHHCEREEAIISEILRQDCFYARIGVPRCADSRQIRHGYLLRSKVCHPDRNRLHPRAKEAFQRLSDAYQTLSDPFHRRQYDLYGKRVGGDEDTFSDAVQQVFNEFMEGHYDTLMRLVDHLQSLNPEINISKEGARTVFSSMRQFCLWSGRCWDTAKFEIITLYEIHMDLQSLSYFDISGRLWKAGQLSRGILSLLLSVAGQGNLFDAMYLW